MKYTEAQAVAKQLAQDISDLYGLDAWRDQGFANFKQDVVRLLTPALQAHAEAESVIGELVGALKSAKEDIEAWREFCRDEDQGVGFGHSDDALKRATNALAKYHNMKGGE